MIVLKFSYKLLTIVILAWAALKETKKKCFKTFYARNLQFFNDKLECLSLASLSSLV